MCCSATYVVLLPRPVRATTPPAPAARSTAASHSAAWHARMRVVASHRPKLIVADTDG